MNSTTPTMTKKEVKKARLAFKVRKTLSFFVKQEIAITPSFKITWIEEKEPKIVKSHSFYEESTDEESIEQYM